jgi:spoIIIJ-associated protein
LKEIEMEGKTVTIAVENGLTEIGLRRDEVDVQVLQEGNAGFLGIGSKLAKVLIRTKGAGTSSSSVVPRPKAAGPQRDTACAAAKDVLDEILNLSEIADAKTEVDWDSEQERVHAEIETADSGLIIGKGGRTLEALQFITTLIVGRKTEIPTAVQVETQGYWKKIEEKLVGEAEQAIAEVKRTGDTYSFEPMEPALRRLLHRTIGDHPDVETASEGEGPWRKVVLKPRGH